MTINQLIAHELQIKETQVQAVVDLLDASNTVPFIARYRKEVTGGLDEEQIFAIEEKMNHFRKLEKRREDILRIIEERDKLTPDLKDQLMQATSLQALEDLYLPYKERRRTLATIACENGLEPLAMLLWDQEGAIDPQEAAQAYLNPEVGLETVDSVLDGVTAILSEKISETAKFRQITRSLTAGYGIIETVIPEETDPSVYDTYKAFSQAITDIQPHRVLAINRGEREKILKVKIDTPQEDILKRLEREIIVTEFEPLRLFLSGVIDASYKKSLKPAIEREIRNALTETAESHSIKSFQLNLRQLLMQQPIADLVIMGVDPAYRTGCKICVIDAIGEVLDLTTIYPHQPHNKVQASNMAVQRMIDQYGVKLIVIGNGTASRETEQFIVDLIEDQQEIAYLIVSESGASVYSASALAREEFPDLDVSMRGAISIARRILDPLAELVKIDPKAIGVGMYQHDVNQKVLASALGQTVTSCVNKVGVDLNTASSALLNYISGINKTIAKNIVNYRSENGIFTGVKDLKKVPRLGAKAFEQCAGFIRIRQSKEFLDNTGVHPESYPVAKALLKKLGVTEAEIKEGKDAWASKLQQASLRELAEELGAGLPTLKDIIAELQRPGHDPRSSMPKPVFSREVVTMEQLAEGQILQGTVRNVVDFGAFVDIGVKQDGLVHISQMSNKFIRHPQEVVSVGQTVKVKVLAVDLKKKRISLSMKSLN